jgi:hypothetical protein
MRGMAVETTVWSSALNKNTTMMAIIVKRFSRSVIWIGDTLEVTDYLTGKAKLAAHNSGIGVGRVWRAAQIGAARRRRS